MAVSPLENAPSPSKLLGLTTQCFKAWCPRTYKHVVLRRVIIDPSLTISREGYFFANELTEARDSSVLRLLDVVPVQEFGDNCEHLYRSTLVKSFRLDHGFKRYIYLLALLFAYEFIPCARTLWDLFMLSQLKTPSKHLAFYSQVL